MTTPRFLAARHPSVLASGAPVAPGEPVPASAVDLDDPHDQHLVDDGLLIDLKPTSRKRSGNAATTGDDTTESAA